MTPRRFAALALAMTMLHLNVVRADAACATHESAPEAIAQAAPEHERHHGDAQSENQRSDGRHSEAPQCESPAQRDCCELLVSCSLQLELNPGERGEVALLAPENVAAPLMNAPLARVAAPDPPPPRA